MLCLLIPRGEQEEGRLTTVSVPYIHHQPILTNYIHFISLIILFQITIYIYILSVSSSVLSLSSCYYFITHTLPHFPSPHSLTPHPPARTHLFITTDLAALNKDLPSFNLTHAANHSGKLTPHPIATVLHKSNVFLCHPEPRGEADAPFDAV